MNEYETNPQRHEATSSEGLSHQPADAPQQDSAPPAEGQSSYAEEPTAARPWLRHVNVPRWKDVGPAVVSVAIVVFSSMNITWNRGLRPRLRSGASSATS